MSTIHTFSLPRDSQDTEAYLATQVKQGRSKSQLIQSALRLLMEQEQQDGDRWEKIEQKLDEIIELLKGTNHADL